MIDNFFSRGKTAALPISSKIREITSFAPHGVPPKETDAKDFYEM